MMPDGTMMGGPAMQGQQPPQPIPKSDPMQQQQVMAQMLRRNAPEQPMRGIAAQGNPAPMGGGVNGR
jgi:hypothetical protein